MIHIDLFSGVGMFAIAAKQSGIKTVAFAEPDKFCQRVLAKHHPDAIIYDDIREITLERLKEDGIVCHPNINNDSGAYQESRSSGSAEVDGGEEGAWSFREHAATTSNQSTTITPNQPTGIILTGGFPCQDLSVAGKQAGIDGERSGLWSEFARIIGDLRPDYTIIENVSALLTGDGGRWFDRILRDLAEIGFDAEWHVIPAGNADGSKLSAGAPHQRLRVWIVAYPSEVGQQCKEARERVEGGFRPPVSGVDTRGGHGCASSEAKSGMGLLANGIASRLSRSRWLPEPRIGRVATGVPDRVNKLKALGNGLVPSVPAAIIQSILEREE